MIYGFWEIETADKDGLMLFCEFVLTNHCI